jgi:hypothetical protein
MKDKLGLYYYPNPLNRQFRMYVKEVAGEVCFRMWRADDPLLWEQHGWVPYGAVRKAAEMYAGKALDPMEAYDLQIARALLKAEGRQQR